MYISISQNYDDTFALDISEFDSLGITGTPDGIFSIGGSKSIGNNLFESHQWTEGFIERPSSVAFKLLTDGATAKADNVEVHHQGQLLERIESSINDLNRAVEEIRRISVKTNPRTKDELFAMTLHKDGEAIFAIEGEDIQYNVKCNSDPFICRLTIWGYEVGPGTARKKEAFSIEISGSSEYAIRLNRSNTS